MYFCLSTDFFAFLLESSYYDGSLKTESDPTSFEIVVKIVIFMYGIWNLDFYRMDISPLCLHPRISALQVITLDYTIALYPLVLIFITYVLVQVHDQSTIVQYVWKPLRQCFIWDENYKYLFH